MTSALECNIARRKISHNPSLVIVYFYNNLNFKPICEVHWTQLPKVESIWCNMANYFFTPSTRLTIELSFLYYYSPFGTTLELVMTKFYLHFKKTLQIHNGIYTKGME